MSSHTGTHIEFSYHHNKNGQDASQFPLERLITKAIVLDLSRKKTYKNVSMEEVKLHEHLIKEGETVIFNFGCAKNYRTEKIHDRLFFRP